LPSRIVIRVRSVSKRFPGVVALDRVDLDIYGGAIHTLLGENGAGKSTLAKVLAGIYVPDSGSIYINERRVSIASPADALRLGIYYVPQMPSLIEGLTVAENLAISLNNFGVLTSMRRIEDFIRAESEEIGIKVDPDAEVSKLSFTQKQVVELFRALLLGSSLLILDEVLSFLPTSEKKLMLSYIGKLKAEGRGVVIITHKIPEAVEIADRITVMRSGRVVAVLDARSREAKDLDFIRTLMFGDRSAAKANSNGVAECQRVLGEPVIELIDARCRDDRGALALRGVSLEVKRGEILGIAGVAGNGQKELVEVLAGLRKLESGVYRVAGVDVTNKGSSTIRKLGVSVVVDSPLSYALAPDASILENVSMGFTRSKLLVKWDEIRGVFRELADEFNLVYPSPRSPVKVLSGGNVMKLHTAIELRRAVNALVLYNPSRMLDEATTKKLRNMIVDYARRRKVGVVLVSEDLDEVLELSDRVAVMSSGRVVGIFDRSSADRDRIESLMVM